MYNEAINSSQFVMLTSLSKYTCTVQVDKTKIDKNFWLLYLKLSIILDYLCIIFLTKGDLSTREVHEPCEGHGAPHHLVGPAQRGLRLARAGQQVLKVLQTWPRFGVKFCSGTVRAPDLCI